MGSEPTPTVPYFNLWTLGWNAEWWSTTGRGYWDAPIFYPTRGAFALSDPQALTGLIAAPLFRLDRASAYNGVLLFFLALDGIAARWLLLRRGVAPPVALLGGLLCQALPFLTHERGVLQLQPIFGLLWALDEIWRLAAGSSSRRGWALGAAIVVTFATSEYFGLFLLVACVPPVLLNLDRFRRRPAALGLALGVAAASVVLVPFLWSQRHQIQKMGFERSLETVERFSASPVDYARLSPRTVGGALRPTADKGGKFLSPGWFIVLLALLGLVAGHRSTENRRWAHSLVAIAVLAFLLSLGPRLALAGWRPYSIVEATVPGLALLRSPFRLAVLVQLAAFLLAALGIGGMLQARKRALAVLAVLLVVAEIAPRPARLAPIPATVEAGGGMQPPAVFIPYVHGGRTSDYLPTVAVMNAVLPTAISLVNGYSGYFPPLNTQLKGLLADFPTERGLAALQALGVRTILVRLSAISPAARGRLADLVRAGTLADLGEHRELRALRLQDSAIAAVTEYRGRWEAEWRWRDEEIELRLTPLHLGERLLVSEPSIAPLRWRARWSARGGGHGEALVTARGTFLLYRDGGYRPRVSLSLPSDREQYRIELLDFESGHPVATLRVAPRE